MIDIRRFPGVASIPKTKRETLDRTKPVSLRDAENWDDLPDEELRQEAERALESLQKSEVENMPLAIVIKFGRTGINNAIHRGRSDQTDTRRERLLLVAHLRRVLRQAVKLWSEPPWGEEPAKNRRGELFLGARVVIGNRRYNAIFHIREYQDGSRYFDHGVLEAVKAERPVLKAAGIIPKDDLTGPPNGPFNRISVILSGVLSGLFIKSRKLHGRRSVDGLRMSIDGRGDDR